MAILGYFGRRGAFAHVSAAAKAAAKNAVSRALASGVLVRPSECSACGGTPVGIAARGVVHAHHEDYGRPLDVVWLCPACHARAHRRLNAAADDGRAAERHAAERARRHGKAA